MQKKNRVVWEFINTGCPCCNNSYVEGYWTQRKRRGKVQKPKTRRTL